MMYSTNSSTRALLASQPIYTFQKDLFACELLFRHETNLSAFEFGADMATSEVILNLCTGVTEQLGLFARQMFINITEELLYAEAFLPIPANDVVLEIPHTVRATDQLLAAIKSWKSRGFQFALDDFDFSQRFTPIMDQLDYIKVDVLNQPLDKVRSGQEVFASIPATWIAKRVETEPQFMTYSELGFTLFQGYFLAKPLAMQGTAIRGKIQNTLGFINTVNKPEIEINEFTAAVGKDPSLATQILKIVNSPACSVRRVITSLKDAIVYLGPEQIRKWVILMVMLNSSAVNQGVIRLILTRAKACENYAKTSIFSNAEQAFLVGLLSGASLLFEIDNNLLVKQLSLRPNVKNAVMLQSGILGQILQDVLKTEYAIGQSTEALCSIGHDLLAAYGEATDWAEKALQSTAG